MLTWQWLAGFFDGEGCVDISANKGNQRHDLRVSIGQKDRGILDKIKNFVGVGTVRYYMKYKKSSYYIYGIFCRQAENLLRKIEPYSLVKNMQIRYALQYMKCKERFGVKHSKNRISNKELRWREMHRQLIKIYNNL